jgi:hypothetical protein
MFKWLIKKGFQITWRKLFGVDPIIDPKDEKLIDSVIPSLEKQLGIVLQGNWWDSLIDGVNRLPRPLMTFGTIFLFFYAIYDPVTFSVWMVALQGIPDNLWYIMGTIILFWFGGKMLVGTPLVSKTNAYAKLLESLKTKKIETTTDFNDETKPLSQEQIDAWNRKHNPNYNKK